MSTLMQSGVPLSPTLEFLVTSAESPQAWLVLNEIHDHILAGHTLSSSLSRESVRQNFSPVVVGMIKLGESSGRLVATIEQLAELTERQQKLERAAASTLTYPCVLALVIAAISCVFVLLLGNKDAGLFAALGGNLPWATRALVTAADCLRNPWLVLSVLLAVALALSWIRFSLSRNRTLRRTFDRLVLHVPALGPLLRKSSSARMLYVIATAASVGMPLWNSLQLARSVCLNLHLEAAYDEALVRFRGGEDLAACLDDHEVFSKLVTSMISVGMESGRLDLMLLRLSHLLADEVDEALQTFIRLAEPILLAVAGVIATFLALAALQPLLSLANRL